MTVKIGDKVKIENPQIFIRCGYPMTLADVPDELFSKKEEGND